MSIYFRLIECVSGPSPEICTNLHSCPLQEKTVYSFCLRIKRKLLTGSKSKLLRRHLQIRERSPAWNQFKWIRKWNKYSGKGRRKSTMEFKIHSLNSQFLWSRAFCLNVSKNRNCCNICLENHIPVRHSLLLFPLESKADCFTFEPASTIQLSLAFFLNESV